MAGAVASGERAPSAALRERLFEVYGIVASDFDVPDGVGSSHPVAPPSTIAQNAPPPRTPPAVVPLPKTSPDATSAEELGDAKTVCAQTVQRLQGELARLDEDVMATSRERASVASSLTSATRLYARLSGALDLTKEQVLRSPHWREVLAVLTDALAPVPGALDAATKALRDFEGGSS
jgi:hypothetical protein